MMKTNQPFDVYQMVTNQIIEQLESGCVPWKIPWTIAGVPQNLISRKPYRGINLWLLSMNEYAQNYFLTFNQAVKLGATVKKGAKAHPVIYWKQKEKEKTETGERIKRFFIRYYTVFNVAQCENIPASLLITNESSNDPILQCEQLINEMPQRPTIQHVDDCAYYSPSRDFINMPPLNSFIHSEGYYGTLFHELTHSTGHTSRLNRKELMEMNPFNTEMYSFEELIAEIGASYLNSLTGIASKEFEQNAAYINGWLLQLKNDKRFIIRVSSQAQKAVDFILGVKEKYGDIEEEEGSN